MSLDAPGFFGKVPARGDFLARRVPPGVAGAWDEWLGRLTVAVREAAGEDWPEAWLTAPLWHFVLGAGIAPPQGAAGVLVASVDRVGRFFPFTIIAPGGGIPDETWSDQVEAEILGALDDGFDPDALDGALAGLGGPGRTVPIEHGSSLWWCRGSDRVEPTRVVVDGLPGAAAARAMVLGGPIG